MNEFKGLLVHNDEVTVAARELSLDFVAARPGAWTDNKTYQKGQVGVFVLAANDHRNDDGVDKAVARLIFRGDSRWQFEGLSPIARKMIFYRLVGV